MSYRPAVFQIDAVASFFHGATQGQVWNGFACPLFTFDEASRLMIINNSTDFCGKITYDSSQDVFLFREFGVDGDEPPDVYRPAIVAGTKFYPVGSHSWGWQEVTEERQAQFSAQLVRELRELQWAGTTVPDRAYALATQENALAGCIEMGVTDATDLILQLAAI